MNPPVSWREQPCNWEQKSILCFKILGGKKYILQVGLVDRHLLFWADILDGFKVALSVWKQAR